MQLKEGTHVFTADNQDVGQIDRVVIDPATEEVTHIIVRQGFLFTEDKVIPMDWVVSATDERVTLRSEMNNLDDLPDFEQTHYVSMPEEERRALGYPTSGYVSPIYGYPPYGAAWPAYSPAAFGQHDQQYAARTEQNIPENTAALKNGARVMSSDEQHVGEIESVLVDSSSKQATHFVISQGLFFKDRKLVPAAWVRTLMEDEVYLGVTARTLEQLPEYQPQ